MSANKSPSGDPLVSVIIPSYNYSNYLTQSVDSILGQDYNNLELILVENGSTDGSLGLARSFRDPRIRLLEFTENCGYVGACRAGLAACTGKYVAIQAADDFSLPTRIGKQVQFLESQSEAGAVTAYIMEVDENGKRPGGETDIEKICNKSWQTEDVKNWAMWNQYTIIATLYRLDLAQDCFPADFFRKWPELAMHVQMLQTGAKLEFLPEILCAHRRHGSNESSSLDTETLREMIYIQRRFLVPLAEKKDQIEALRKTGSSAFLDYFDSSVPKEEAAYVLRHHLIGPTEMSYAAFLDAARNFHPQTTDDWLWMGLVDLLVMCNELLGERLNLLDERLKLLDERLMLIRDLEAQLEKKKRKEKWLGFLRK